MAGTKDSFSYGKGSSFIYKIFSLLLPCNMAAVQNLYTLGGALLAVKSEKSKHQF